MQKQEVRMLTIVEIYQQNRLKNKGAELFEVTVGIITKNDEIEEHSLEFYAENEDEALLMGEKLRFRMQEKINEGNNLIDRLGLNFRESLNNKWGFIAPWKDPIYKRSLIRGTKLPYLRILADFKSLIASSESKYTWVKKEKLTRSEINDHISKCVRDYFICAFIFIFTTYFLIINLLNNHPNTMYLLMASGFSYAFGSIHFIKVIIKHRVLLSWKGDKDGQ